MDQGPERITDAAERAQVQAQARKVMRKAIALSLVLTAVAWLLPL